MAPISRDDLRRIVLVVLVLTFRHHDDLDMEVLDTSLARRVRCRVRRCPTRTAPMSAHDAFEGDFQEAFSDPVAAEPEPRLARFGLRGARSDHPGLRSLMHGTYCGARTDCAERMIALVMMSSPQAGSVRPRLVLQPADRRAMARSGMVDRRITGNPPR